MGPIVKAVKAAIRRGKIDGQWTGHTYLKPCQLAAIHQLLLDEEERQYRVLLWVKKERRKT